MAVSPLRSWKPLLRNVKQALFQEAAHTLHALLEARRLFADIELKMNGLDINSPEECFMAYVKNLYTIDLHYRHFIHEANQAESQQLLASIAERCSWHTPTTIS